MNLKSFKKLKLPDKPGVYFFQKGKSYIYIGKATSLESRVRSYFASDLIHTRGPVLVDMLIEAKNIKWQVTDSVLEALILEAELIKKYQPKYNTKEKSDKSFLSVVITKEKLPRVLTIRTHNLKQHSHILKNVRMSKVYGPFTSGPQLKEALKIIRPIFPYLDDKSKNYYKFYKNLNLVPDIDTPEGIKKYKENIKHLKLFFEGKKKKVLQNLKKEMNAYAKNREFEKAGVVKRQIFALNHINDVALIKQDKNFTSLPFRIEAYDIAHMSGKSMVGVMTVVEDGEAKNSDYRKFKIRTQSGANDTGALTEMLERRFNHTEWPYPSLIVVDGALAQINTAKKTISKFGIHTPIVSVVKDDRHKAKALMGDETLALKWKKAILLANSEAHRFSITYHKNLRSRNFLK